MKLRCKTIFVALAAVDLQNLIEFYTHLLERSPVLQIPATYAEFDLPHLRLGIFKPKQNHQAEFAAQPGGSMSLCLEVEDLEAAIKHLTAIGYPPPGEIAIASHGKEIYAYDPAGNRLILHQSF
jgi:predicted enzyme related to lactoylglutathione lyase